MKIKYNRNDLIKNPYDLYPLGTIIEATENPDPEHWHACDASAYEDDTEVDLPMIPIGTPIKFSDYSELLYWEYKKVFVRRNGLYLYESTDGSTWTRMSEFTYNPPDTNYDFSWSKFKIINNQFVITSYCEDGNYMRFYVQIYTLNEDNLLVSRCNHLIVRYRTEPASYATVFAIQWKPNESIIAGFFYMGDGASYVPYYAIKEISMVSYEIINSITSNYSDTTTTLSSIVYRDGVISYYHNSYHDYYIFINYLDVPTLSNLYGSYYYKDSTQRKNITSTNVYNDNIVAYSNYDTVTVYSNMSLKTKIQSLPPGSLLTYSKNTCKVFNMRSSNSNLFYWIRDSKFIGPFEIENEKILAPDTISFYSKNIIHVDDGYMYSETGSKYAYIKYIPYIKNSYIKLK